MKKCNLIVKLSYILLILVIYGCKNSAVFKKTSLYYKKNPLYYMADYSVNAKGNGLVNTYDNNKQGYFNWYEATGNKHYEYNPTGKNIFNNLPKKYYLPSKAELTGIFQLFKDVFQRERNVYGDTPDLQLNILERIEFPKGEINTYSADYISEGKGVVYGLKLKNKSGSNGSKTVAYRYRLLGKEGSSDFRLVIESKYVGTDSSITIKTITKNSYWNRPDVTKIIPASGWINEEGGLNDKCSLGYVWGSDTYGGLSTLICGVGFGPKFTYLGGYSKNFSIPVRPFFTEETGK